MGAFGILAALRERDGAPGHPGSGEGQFVDVSMADGALSWLALVAGRHFAEGTGAEPRRACRLARLAHLLPPVSVRRRVGDARGARAEILAGVVSRRRARGAHRASVRASRLSRPTCRSRAIFMERTRAEWAGVRRPITTAAWSPVLELDEALGPELVRDREMVVELRPAGGRARRCASSACR